jgi:hypothetical protein
MILPISKSLLHVRLLLQCRTLLTSPWPCLSGAGHVRHKLPIQEIVADSTWQSISAVDGLGTTARTGPQGLGFHEPLNLMRATAMTQLQHVFQDPAGAISSVTGHKALIHMRADHFINPCPITLGPRDPGVKAASRDTERLAQ